MALESLPKIAPALFSAEQDLIQIYNKKSDTFGVINASLIGGNTPPSGVSGAIQFSNGSAFASDAANLFWDDTNNRLGVGTNAPTQTADIFGNVKIASATSGLLIRDYTAFNTFKAFYKASETPSDSNYLIAMDSDVLINSRGSGTDIYYNNSLRARFGNSTSLLLKGSGSTSATTSLLVQNSAGTAAVTVKDDLSATFGGTVQGGNLVATANINFGNILYGNSFWSQSDGGTTIGQQAAPVASAIFEIRSTTRGLLPPRLSTSQKTAIASPAAGLMVYDTNLNKLCVYNGSAWETITSV